METNQNQDKKLRLITQELYLMEPNLIHQETEDNLLSSMLEPAKLFHAGTKVSLSLKEVKRQFSTAHQTWLMDPEVQEASSNQIPLSNSMLN